jgi:hypothetical protein
MRPKFQIQHDPMRELDRLRNNVSMEAIGLDGIRASLADFLPSVKENFERFANKFSQRENAIALKGNESAFLKHVSTTPYLGMSTVVAYVPEGLAVPYNDYLAVLKDAADHCYQTTEKSINEFSTFLAQIITNRELKYYVAPQKQKYDLMEKTRAELVNRLSDCFNQTQNTTVLYTDVVERNSDWGHVFSNLRTVSTTVNKISHTALHKKSDECNMLLSSIIRQIQNDAFADAGPEVTNNLASGAYQVACEIEFFSVVYYRLATLNTAIGDTMAKIIP